jgi:hypothetical protein
MKKEYIFCFQVGPAHMIQGASVIPIAINLNGYAPTTDNAKALAEKMNQNVVRSVMRLAGYAFFYELIPEGGKVLEIGCHMGDGLMAYKIAGAAEVVGVDPWASQEWDGWFNCSQDAMDRRYLDVVERVGKIGGVTLVREYSKEYFKHCPKGYFDCVYIDGDHRKDGVIVDVAGAVEAVKVGGYIGIDDMFCKKWKKDIGDGLNEWLAENPGRLEAVYIASDPVVLRRIK